MNIFELEIDTIRILLGDNCNFNCKYCIENKKTNLPTKINPDIYNFIKKACLGQNKKIQLSFYGGEPLLYFNNIKEIVKKTKNLNLYYSITTNGSLLNQEMIDFFNKYNFVVWISWDGNNTKDNRNIDIFNDITLKNKIFNLNILGISAVMSSHNYPLQLCNDIQEIMNEYNTFNPNSKEFAVYFNEITDNNLVSKEYLYFDYEKLENEVQEIINDVKNNLNLPFNDFQKKSGVKLFFLKQYISFIEEYKFYDKFSQLFAPCRDGIKMFEIDLDGNLYSCQNTRDKIGHINNLDLITYLINYFKYDNTKDLYEKLCKNCSVRKICYTRCKLVSLESRINNMCKLKHAIGKPILDFYDNYYKNNKNCK